MNKKSINKNLMDTLKDHYENPTNTVKKEYQRMVTRIQKEISQLENLTKEVIFKRVLELLENGGLLIVGLSGLNIQIEHVCFWNEDNKDFNPFILKNQFDDLVLAWSCKKTEKLYQFCIENEIVSNREEFDGLVGIITIYDSDKRIVFQENLTNAFIEANVSAITTEESRYKYLYIHSYEDLFTILEEIYLEKL